jgi:hypothetical protein
MKTLLQNWRTTLVGVIAIVVTVGFVMGTVSEHAFLAVLGVLIGGVGAVAKDGAPEKESESRAGAR